VRSAWGEKRKSQNKSGKDVAAGENRQRGREGRSVDEERQQWWKQRKGMRNSGKHWTGRTKILPMLRFTFVKQSEPVTFTHRNRHAQSFHIEFHFF
jgi:hypothetical protein